MAPRCWWALLTLSACLLAGAGVRPCKAYMQEGDRRR
jgi:hypothetical protein